MRNATRIYADLSGVSEPGHRDDAGGTLASFSMTARAAEPALSPSGATAALFCSFGTVPCPPIQQNGKCC